jgi:hypothetical protein
LGGGLSRRELLKRGAIAGATLWATPIMHSVGMAQVDSEDTSPLCRATLSFGLQYCDRFNTPVHDFELCVTGCVCAGRVWLVYSGEDSGLIEIPVGPDGCYQGTFRGGRIAGSTLTLWAECRDDSTPPVVVARSADVVVTWGPYSDCQD